MGMVGMVARGYDGPKVGTMARRYDGPDQVLIICVSHLKV